MMDLFLYGLPYAEHCGDAMIPAARYTVEQDSGGHEVIWDHVANRIVETEYFRTGGLAETARKLNLAYHGWHNG